MDYFISFLEGVISFLSPCILPMVPIYLSYLIGRKKEEKLKLIHNAIAFTLGFTIVFVLLGVLAGTLGMFMSKYQRAIQHIFGVIMIVFGLHYMDIFQIKLLQKGKNMQAKQPLRGFASSMFFGVFFAIGWTPCVGIFLGAALMMAASQTEMIKGVLLLLCFSLGLGIPFLLCSILLEQLNGAFTWIKNHYHIINKLAGGLLIVMGLLMIIGKWGG